MPVKYAPGTPGIGGMAMKKLDEVLQDGIAKFESGDYDGAHKTSNANLHTLDAMMCYNGAE